MHDVFFFLSLFLLVLFFMEFVNVFPKILIKLSSLNPGEDDVDLLLETLCANAVSELLLCSIILLSLGPITYEQLMFL